MENERTLRDDEVLSPSQAAAVLSDRLTPDRARQLLRARVAAGDPWPAKIRGEWVAPYFWWREVSDPTALALLDMNRA